MLWGLRTSGASMTQCLAYLCLTRWHHDKDGDHDVCWVSAEKVAALLETDVSTISRALRGLCSKTFRTRDGRLVPVLSRVSGGHNGSSAVYRDNLYACLVGGQICLPTAGSRWATTTTYSPDVENRVGRQTEPSRWAILPELVGNPAYPIEGKECQEVVVGGALRPAQSAARRRTPTPQEETGKVGVPVSKGEPAEEPGPDDAKALRELWEDFKARGELTQEQRALKERFERSETWREICRH